MSDEKISERGAAHWVKGICPACGHRDGMFVGAGGYLTCSWIDCPEPDAPSNLLSSDARARLRELEPVVEAARRVEEWASMNDVGNGAISRMLRPSLAALDSSPRRLAQEDAR